MPDDAPKAVRKLTLTSREQVTSGVSKNGGTWTLWKVAALDEQGTPVDLSLKMFGDPPLNELAEFEVERQDHEKYGTSFMLSLPKGKRGLGTAVDRLRERVDALEQRVDQIVTGVPAGASDGSQSGPARPPMARAGVGPPPAAPPATSDEDIPF